MPVFCDASPFAGGAANQENRRLNALFQMHGLQNTFGFSLHDADLKQYMFAFSGCRPALSRVLGGAGTNNRQPVAARKLREAEYRCSLIESADQDPAEWLARCPEPDGEAIGP
ncbi:hypothetical protein C9413_23070 [Rhizobium sp. SEMIA 4085]|nr:hypothetical protein [Rhizobium gallicum]NNH32241.1 hypothetical protein [Rhizobium sp. SEMIA 4085]